MLFFPVVVFPGWRLGVSVFGSLLPGWGLGVSALHLFPRLEARSIDFSSFSQAGWSEYQLSIFPGLEARSINFPFVSLAGGSIDFAFLPQAGGSEYRLSICSQAGGSEYPFLALLIPGANKTDPVWGLVS